MAEWAAHVGGHGPFDLLTAEENEQLEADLAEIAAMHRRGWATSAHVVIW